jgi:hypothetical protein
VAEQVFTLGVWRAKPGQGKSFIEAWKALGEVFAQLPDPPAGVGTLLQSVSDPNLFYSFGPWRRLEDIQAMRGNPAAQEGIKRVAALCTEATPGAFRMVAESAAPRLEGPRSLKG